MTQEIFRNDAYEQSATATVIGATVEGIVLDRTVFYPEGGGQPGDRGQLLFDNGSCIEIIDTLKTQSSGLLHVPKAGALLPAAGSHVTASIDWEFRYRHMRTHTCLHLLCALIPHDVTGGAISQDKGRLDFDMTDTLDKETLQEELQRLIVEDHPISYRWITDEEMERNMALVRTMSVKPPLGQGKVRLVEVKDLDLQPCGGTHVARTVEIGEVRIGKVEKKGKHNRRVNVHLA